MEASDSLRQKKIKFFLSYTWHIHIYWDTQSVHVLPKLGLIQKRYRLLWDILTLQRQWIFTIMRTMSVFRMKWKKQKILSENQGHFPFIGRWLFYDKNYDKFYDIWKKKDENRRQINFYPNRENPWFIGFLSCDETWRNINFIFL